MSIRGPSAEIPGLLRQAQWLRASVNGLAASVLGASGAAIVRISRPIPTVAVDVVCLGVAWLAARRIETIRVRVAELARRQ